MSYIRSGSNPEGLYIWGDGETAYIVAGTTSIGNMPSKILNNLIKKYKNNQGEECEYKGASIKEDFNKMKLSYNDWSFTMYYVTWHYIVSTN